MTPERSKEICTYLDKCDTVFTQLPDFSTIYLKEALNEIERLQKELAETEFALQSLRDSIDNALA